MAGNSSDEVKSFDYDYDARTLDYQLVWADEFDYEGAPDPTKWSYSTGGHGWGNNELQYYTPGDNVSVRDGRLVIEARREPREGREYTSTRMLSKDKGDWLYGRFEVCARLPRGRGTWPAIWMMPTDSVYGNWPDSGELDIMEHVGHNPNQIHASVHTRNYYHKIQTQKTATTQAEQVDERFHVYTLEWLPDRLHTFVDGQKYFTFDPLMYAAAPTFRDWPFDRRFYMILNIAVGGFWGGAEGIDDSIWPQRMEVEYVRVYQSPQITRLAQERAK